MTEAPVTQILTIDELVYYVERLEKELAEYYNLDDPVQRTEYYYDIWSRVKSSEAFWRFLKEHAGKLASSFYTDVEVDAFEYGNELNIEIFLSRKYLEVDEACAHAEGEDEFYECFEEVLGEINAECLSGVGARIDLRKELSIETWDVECGGNYCRCGTVVLSRYKGSRPSESLSLLALHYPKVVEVAESLMRLV